MTILILLASAFLVQEIEQGSVIQCIYEDSGNQYVITIPNTKVCKPIINVE